MTHQRFQFLLPSLSLKATHYMLLRRGVAYLLPLSLIGSGVAFGNTPQSSTVEPLSGFNEESQSASDSLESYEISASDQDESAVPDYDSVAPMGLNDEEEAPVEQAEIEQEEASAQVSDSEVKTALEPIDPLTNSSDTPDIDHDTSVDEPEQETATDSPEPEVTAEEIEPEQETATDSPEPEVTAEEVEPEQETATDSQDYVDLEGYPLAGEEALPDPQVEISDRENNCTTVIENDKLVSGSCNISEQETPREQTFTAPQDLPELPTDFQQPTASEQQEPTASESEQESYSTYTPPEDLPELQVADNGDTNLIFPLSRAARISSGFGWRRHPITGKRNFHAGVDFAAPEGTPVVATRSGKVAYADYRGGYGLIVGLHHEGDQYESRYAHLSQIHVRPGEWVEQGTVIGRVGSTGTSSGPHLHFEWRVRRGHRWVAVDATDPLLVARDNIGSSQIAFNDNGVGSGNANGQGTNNNFFTSLPEMLNSISREPASWMAMPKLDFLQDSDFERAHERQAPLGNFSEVRDAISILPFSLPQVLASLFNWQPPQLFVDENLEQVPSQQVASNDFEFTYRYPDPDSDEIERTNQATNLESLSNLDALGELNFPSPHQENPQQFSQQREDVDPSLNF